MQHVPQHCRRSLYLELPNYYCCHTDHRRPNVDELKGKVNALEETISKAKLRQDEIRKELDGRRRGGNDTESNDIRKHLQALRNEFQQVLVRVHCPGCNVDVERPPTWPVLLG